MSYTPSFRVIEGEAPFLDRDTIEKFTGFRGSNTWIDHSHRAHCVTVHRNAKKTGYFLVYDGPAIARSAVVRNIQGPKDQRMVTWEEEVLRQHADGKYFELLEVPQPPLWTVASFMHYVSIITTLPQATSALRLHRPWKINHRNSAVGQMLLELYTSAASQPYMSGGALVKVLAFFHKHTELSHIATRIWEISAESGLTPSVQSFNWELSRSLNGKSYTRVMELLSAMATLGVRPNKTTVSLPMTWTSTPSQRMLLLNVASQLKDSDPVGKTNLICAWIKGEIPRYLAEHGEGFDEFLVDTANIFGNDWFNNAKVLAKLIRVCYRHGFSASVSQSLIKLLKQSQERPMAELMKQPETHDLLARKDVFYELLLMSQACDDMAMAVELFLSSAAQKQVHLEQKALTTFFRLAWERRYYNVCRLVWVFAGVNGRISTKATLLVRWSWGRKSAGIAPNAQQWLQNAGKVILGIGGSNLQLYSDAWKTITDQDQEVTLQEHTHRLFNTKLGDEGWEEVAAMRDLLVERDQTSHMRYQRLQIDEFQTLLKQAYETDLAWKGDQATEKWTADQIQQQLIHIPLVPRANPRMPTHGIRKEFQLRDKFIDYASAMLGDTIQITGTTAGVSMSRPESASRTLSEASRGTTSAVPTRPISQVTAGKRRDYAREVEEMVMVRSNSSSNGDSNSEGKAPG